MSTLDTKRLRELLEIEQEKTRMAGEAGQMLLTRSSELEGRIKEQQNEYDQLESKYNSSQMEVMRLTEKLEEGELSANQNQAKLREVEAKLLAQSSAPLEDDSEQIKALESQLSRKNKMLNEKGAENRNLKKEIDALSSELSLQRETHARMSMSLSKAEGKRKCDIVSLERKIGFLRGLLSESNAARENTAAEMERLSELTVSLKRELLDTEHATKSMVPLDSSSSGADLQRSVNEFSPYLNRVLMLFAAQVSRLEVDLEISLKERENAAENAQSRRAWLFTLAVWLFGIAGMLTMC